MKLRSFTSLALVLMLLNSFATHLTDTDIAYKHIKTNSDGSVEYEVTLRVIRDCFQSDVPLDDKVKIGIYINNSTFDHYQTIEQNLEEKYTIQPENCVSSNSFCNEVGFYVKTITFPANSTGYVLIYDRCCRTASTNLWDDGSGMPEQSDFAISIIPSSTQVNHSAVCENQIVMVNAGQSQLWNLKLTDLDGDSLAVSLTSPLVSDADLLNPIPIPGDDIFEAITTLYKPGYSANAPFGPNGVINQTATGTFEIKMEQGNYAVGFLVTEYRNGTLIHERVIDGMVYAFPSGTVENKPYDLDVNYNGANSAKLSWFNCSPEVDFSLVYRSEMSANNFSLIDSVLGNGLNYTDNIILSNNKAYVYYVESLYVFKQI